MHPKHSTVVPSWSLVIEEFATDNWVKVLWNMSPTRRKQQRMRHTAFGQLKSFFHATTSPFSIVESLCFTFCLKPQASSFKQFLFRFKNSLPHVTCDVFAPDFSCSIQFCFFKPKNRRKTDLLAFRTREIIRDMFFLPQAAQTADKEKSINSTWRDVLINLHPRMFSSLDRSSKVQFYFFKQKLKETVKETERN